MGFLSKVKNAVKTGVKDYIKIKSGVAGYVKERIYGHATNTVASKVGVSKNVSSLYVQGSNTNTLSPSSGSSNENVGSLGAQGAATTWATDHPAQALAIVATGGAYDAGFLSSGTSALSAGSTIGAPSAINSLLPSLLSSRHSGGGGSSATTADINYTPWILGVVAFVLVLALVISIVKRKRGR